MKLLLCALAILFISDRVQCDLDPVAIIDECMKETGLPDDKYVEPIDETDPEVRCFIACLYRKSGFLVDGRFDEDRFLTVIKMFFPKADESIIKMCAAKGKAQSDECEMAGTAEVCIHQELGTLGSNS